MKALRNYLDKIKPNFEEGGKFHAFRSVFDGFETFLFVPSKTAKTGTHIHDAIDSKAYYVDCGYFVSTGAAVRYVQRRLPAFSPTQVLLAASSKCLSTDSWLYCLKLSYHTLSVWVLSSS